MQRGDKFVIWSRNDNLFFFLAGTRVALSHIIRARRVIFYLAAIERTLSAVNQPKSLAGFVGGIIVF